MRARRPMEERWSLAAGLCALTVIFAPGCGRFGFGGGDLGDRDGGVVIDAGAFDAGAFDAGAFDAVASDAPPGDGSVEVDGAVDVGAVDGSADAAVLPGAVEVATGGDTSCARTGTGEVYCWGSNHRGRLGIGAETPTRSMTPMRVVGIDDAVEIAAGRYVACARRASGEVWCWGDNGHGACGNGTVGTPCAAPVRVMGITAATSLEAGMDHICAIQASEVWCWGANYNAQIDSTYVNRSVATRVPGTTGAIAVDGSEGSTCLVDDAGDVKCWGRLLIQRPDGGTDAFTPTTVTGVSNVTKISMGMSHACVVQADGSSYCWGADGAAQCSSGGSGFQAAPIRTAVPTALDVSLGEFTSCFLYPDLRVGCFGYNVWGNASGRPGNNQHGPAFVSNVSDVVSFSAAGRHTCAVNGAQEVYCWGFTPYGQLGDGEGNWRNTPQIVAGLSGLPSQVAMSANFTCTLSGASNDMHCWGYNRTGELGTYRTDSSSAYRDHPVPTAVLEAGFDNLVQMAVGLNHACAIDSDDVTWCWGGADDWGTRAISATHDGSPWQPFPRVADRAPAGVTRIFGGSYTMCGVVGAGEDLYCWGANNRGQLGRGNTAFPGLPGIVTGDLDVAEMTMGHEHVCAVTSGDGAVYCWGRNDLGQLGIGRVDPLPTVVTTPQSLAVTGYRRIAAGLFSTCGIDSAQRAMCWGRNDQGQLGNGSVVSPWPSPQIVSGGHVAISIAVGDSHACMVTNGGLAFCWGDNFYGQLGDGTNELRRTPQPVLLAGATPVAVAAAGNTTCVLTTTDLRCFGDSFHGQIGTGVSGYKMMATRVAGF